MRNRRRKKRSRILGWIHEEVKLTIKFSGFTTYALILKNEVKDLGFRSIGFTVSYVGGYVRVDIPIWTHHVSMEIVRNVDSVDGP